MCYNNKQQVGCQVALNQVHQFHCHGVHYNSEWLLLTITLIDDRLNTHELRYTISKLSNWVVLQPSPQAHPLCMAMYGFVSLQIWSLPIFFHWIIEDIIPSNSFIMLKFINTRSFCVLKCHNTTISLWCHVACSI